MLAPPPRRGAARRPSSSGGPALATRRRATPVAGAAGGLPARARLAGALLPAAGARNGDSAAREDRRAGRRSSHPPSPTSDAPTSCSSRQQRDTKYIEPAREVVAARACARARPGLGARDARVPLRLHRRRTTSPARSSTRRCGSTSSTPRHTARWRSCRTGRGARSWSRRRCRKRSASRRTTGCSTCSSGRTIWIAASGRRPANSSATRSTSCRTTHARYNNLGLVYRGLGKLDDAAAAFQKAIDLEPTFLRCRNLGMVLAEAGNTRRPSRRSRRSIELRPNQYRAWGILASVYANQHADAAKVRDTYLKAIALADDLLKQTPKDEYLLADVGGYYAAVGMEKKSVPLLAQAAALGAGHPRSALPGSRRVRAGRPP